LTSEFKGHGPSRISIVSFEGSKAIRKTFPTNEFDRLTKEVFKLRTLGAIGETCGRFKVPHVLSVAGSYYILEYIDTVPLPRENVVKNIHNILTAIANVSCQNNSSTNGSTGKDLWQVMLLIFRTAKSNDAEYFDIVERLQEPNQLSLGYSHGDLTLDNILCDRAGCWYLVDPSWSQVESPIWDVGKILQSTAANWDQIKSTGVVGAKPAWLDAINRELIGLLAQSFTPDEMLLGLACQLARVSRWCFADELIRVIKMLLKTHLRGDDNERLDALRRIV